MIGEAAEEEVVVDTGEDSHGGIHDAGPLMQRRQPAGVLCQAGRVADERVDDAHAVVRQRGPLCRGHTGPVPERLCAQQLAPPAVDVVAVGVVEHQPGQFGNRVPGACR